MSRFLSPRLGSLQEYVPGEQPQDRQYIKLNTNESPYPPAPEVLSAIDRQRLCSLNLYPDPDCKQLVAAAAQNFGVSPENIVVTNGSDEALNFCFMAFCGADRGVMFPAISYGFYRVFARLYGLDSCEVPLCEDYSIAVQDYFAAHRTVVIANPNAPTGKALPREDIERLLRHNRDSVVIIDEAYVDFGAQSALPLIESYDNLIVVQTCSKSRSLAGARLGFAFAQPELIADLQRIRNSTNPYNINSLTLAAGEAAMRAGEYYADCCEKIIATRNMTAQALEKLGFDVLQSSTNFLFARSGLVSGEQLYLELKRRGVLVRWFNDERISDFVRISVGTAEQMEALIKCITEVLQCANRK